MNIEFDNKLSTNVNDEENELRKIKVKTDDDDDDEPQSVLVNVENRREETKCCQIKASWYQPAVLKQIQCVLCAGLIGVIGGYTIVYPGLFLALWEQPDSEIHLSLREASLFASAFQFSCIPAALVSGFLQEITGPKAMMMINLPILAVTFSVTQYCAQWGWLLIILRIIQGFSASSMCTAQLVYLAEIPDVQRSYLSSSFTTSWAIGYLLAYILVEALTWHQMGYVMIFITVACFFAFFTAHESPQWLIRRGNYSKAVEVLKSIRITSDTEELKNIPISSVTEDLEKIQISSDTKNLDFQHKNSSVPNIPKNSSYETLLLLKQLQYFVPTILCFLILILREMTGYVSIMHFGIQIFRKLGLPLSPAISMILLITGIIFFNFICMILMAHFKRRSILVLGTIICAISCIIASIYFYLELRGLIMDTNWIPLISLIMLIVSNTIALMPTMAAVGAEILPTSVKSMGCGIALFGSYLGCGLGSASFLHIKDYYGLHICFLLFGISCVSILLITVFMLPETMGRNIQEIDNYWRIFENKYANYFCMLCSDRGSKECDKAIT